MRTRGDSDFGMIAVARRAPFETDRHSFPRSRCCNVNSTRLAERGIPTSDLRSRVGWGNVGTSPPRRRSQRLIADLVGKGGHIRTVPVPDWVKAGIDAWTAASGITAGTLLRSINKAGRVWGTGFSPKVIWGVVKRKAMDCEIPALAPHDLRRTCARLCHQAGGELEQIQFLLGYVSVQTTERYLGCKQRFRNAVNDRIGLEPGTMEPQ
jgi:integrase